MPEDRDAADGGESSDGGSSDRLARRHHDGVDGADPHPASTLMIMVDGFEAVARARKRAKVLDQVSWVIVDTLRRTDMVYRNGESGFCAVLANTPEDQAFRSEERRVGKECLL